MKLQLRLTLFRTAHSLISIRGLCMPPLRQPQCGLIHRTCVHRTMSASAKSAPQNVLRIALEGNIASGKSTFLEILRSEFNVTCVPEPVSRWQDVTGEGRNEAGGNVLGLFYSDPKRWAYTFQTYAFLSRLKAQLEPMQRPPDGGGPADTGIKTRKDIILFERSVFSDKFIFATNCREMGLFNDVEWAIYREWHAWLTTSFDTSLDAIVYLRTTPETCLRRLQKRQRAEEVGVSLDYLTSLHRRHEEWLVGAAAGDWNGPAAATPRTLVLDCDGEFAADAPRRAALLAQVRDFIAALPATAAA